MFFGISFRTDGITEVNEKEMEHRIEKAIIRDDKDSVISLMSSHNLSFAKIGQIWERVCVYDAVNCAASLLDGEFGEPAIDVTNPTRLEFYPLHYAAGYACPRVINLILNRGARTDIIRDHPHLANYGRLPLEIALDTARRFFSTFLGQPVLNTSLECCKLLALSSKNVAKKACDYVRKGELTEFAILLMVAREKVLVPIGDDRSKSMTFHQYLLNEIWSLIDEEWKIPNSLAKKGLTPNRQKKMVLSSAALLVDVFEKAGKDIEEYVQSQQGRIKIREQEEDGSNEEVEKDVGLRLQRVGFTLKDGDFDFRVINWMNSHDFLRTPIKQVETPSGSLKTEGLFQGAHPPSSLLQQPNYHPGLTDGTAFDEMATEYRIENAIIRDDKGSLIWLMSSDHNLSFLKIKQIWKRICTYDAVNCAASLLDGEFGEPAIDVNHPTRLQFYPLHYAAGCACPRVINLILNRGALTDIAQEQFYLVDDYTQLPLGIALDTAKCFLFDQFCFEPGVSSCFQLLLFLCHPRMKPSLECCKLLALSSKNVAKTACDYVNNGALTEFAILLMVAREKDEFP